MAVIPGVMATYDKLKSLHKMKNDDYSGDRGNFYNFEVAEFFSSMFVNARDKVYAVLFAIKIARLAVLLSKLEKPLNEPIEDSFDDAINYLTIWKADYMERGKKHPTVSALTTDVRESK